MGRAWVVGEALIDLIPDSAGGQLAVVGGGAANTARALSGLGVETNFVGGISSDKYGQLIRRELGESGVDLSLAFVSDLPTALAKVVVDDSGSASYEFLLEQTATFAFDKWKLPKGSASVVHIGTLVTIMEPGSRVLFDWLSGIKAPIVFDPNVRPSVLDDRDEYRMTVEKWVEISSVVKVSDEDLSWLYPNQDHLKVINNWIRDGIRLVVMTRGAAGIRAINSDGVYEVPGIEVDVVDTVGAGDTVGAIVVEAIVEHGLDELKNQRLTLVLERAAKAAAITCSRAGAIPPLRGEIESYFLL